MSSERDNWKKPNNNVISQYLYIKKPTLTVFCRDSSYQKQFLKMSSELVRRNLNVKEIDPKLFANSSSLTKIDLSYNQISIIPNDIFKFNKLLTILILSNNNIKVLESCFKPLSLLKVLDLSFNKIKHISKTTLKSNTQLRILLLNSNRLVGLKNKSFKKLANLRYLNLSRNRLDNLKLSLKPLINLQHLDVSVNELITIQTPFFATGNALKTLQLYSNPLTIIDPKFLKKMQQLCAINLSNTYILNLDPSFFENNSNLEELSLNNCMFENYTDLFSGMRNLTVLSLAFDNIHESDIQIAFRDLKKLRSLNLGSNRLMVLDNSNILCENDKLQVLNLENNCYLQTLTVDFFRTLVNLYTFNMVDCDVHRHVDFDMFQFNKRLRKLSLSYAFMFTGQLPETLTTLKYYAKYFDQYIQHEFPNFIENFERNQLEKLSIRGILNGVIESNYFRNFGHLTNLNLSNNGLTILPEMLFANLLKLKKLKLDHNSLHTLVSPIFGPKNRVEKLSLNACKIKKISYIFFVNLTRLLFLSLAHNSFLNLEENTFYHLPHIKCIRLESGLLSNLHVNIFRNNQHLIWIHLEHNASLKGVSADCFKNLRSLEVVYYSSDMDLNINGKNPIFQLVPIVKQSNDIDFDSLLYLAAENK